MIVTLAIFSIITGVILARYRDFSGGIILSNLAYEVAITVRQAQVYGLSVRDVGASNFNFRYGIHLAYPTNNTFVLFADADGNGRYTDGTEIVESLTTLQGNTIQDFCGILASGVRECATNTLLSPSLGYLDIMFLRPNPDALFQTGRGGVYQAAEIVVASPTTGRTRTITVRTTGQISVQ